MIGSPTTGSSSPGTNSQSGTTGSENPGTSSELWSTQITYVSSVPGSHSHGINSHSHTVNSHTHTGANHSHTVTSHSHTMGAHTHSMSTWSNDHTHNVTIAAHTHTQIFGIYEEDNSPVTVHYHIDNGSGFGGASGNYTSDQTDLDITASVTGAGWKAIRFDVDKRCRVAAIIECKIDLTA